MFWKQPDSVKTTSANAVILSGNGAFDKPLLCHAIITGNMNQLIDIALQNWPWIVGGLVVVAAWMLLRTVSEPRWLPYEPRKALVTKSELRFYRSLQKAVMDDWEIFAMVRIADIIKVTPNSAKYRSWLNKILSKHIDFVLCNPVTLEIVCGIELDDVSHSRPERIERDKFVNHAFESARLPLLRIPVEKAYKASEVRELIEAALG